MKHTLRNIFLIFIAAVMLVSFTACKEDTAIDTDAEGALRIETVKILPKAYITNPLLTSYSL